MDIDRRVGGAVTTPGYEENYVPEKGAEHTCLDLRPRLIRTTRLTHRMSGQW